MVRGLALIAGLCSGCLGFSTDGPDALPPADFVVDSFELPLSVGEVTGSGFDLDGDGSIDNALGASLLELRGMGIDVQPGIDAGIATGAAISLASLSASDFANAADALLFAMTGRDPSPPACEGVADTICRHHLDGNGAFEVDTSAPSWQGSGIIEGGAFANASQTAEPFPLRVVLFPGTPAVDLTLVGARIELENRGDSLTGRLGGAIPEAVSRSQLQPALVSAIQGLVGLDCLGGIPPDCCVPGTAGDALVDLFDTNGDCAASEAEITGSATFQTIFASDVDLLDQNDNFAPGRDMVPDGLSLGVRFTAVSASIARPE